MNFIFLVGLPGSGKTTWGDNYIALHKDAVFLDDLSQNGGKGAIIESIVEAVEGYMINTIIVSDFSFIELASRQRAAAFIRSIYPSVKIHYHYWESDPQQCLQNIQSRKSCGDNRAMPNLTVLSRKYNVPKCGTQHSVRYA